MSINLVREKRKALAGALAKDIKTEKDLNALQLSSDTKLLAF
jgi:hypothetical protein